MQRIQRLTAATLCALTTFGSGLATAEDAITSTMHPVIGAWSEPINEARGRIVIGDDRKPDDDHEYRAMELSIQLKRLGQPSFAIWSQPKVDWKLTDVAGKDVPRPLAGAGSDMADSEFLATVPPGCTLGLDFSLRFFSDSEPTTTLLKVGRGGVHCEEGEWLVKPGRYTLSAKLSAEKFGEIPAWTGSLDLPSITITVGEPRPK